MRTRHPCVCCVLACGSETAFGGGGMVKEYGRAVGVSVARSCVILRSPAHSKRVGHGSTTCTHSRGRTRGIDVVDRSIHVSIRRGQVDRLGRSIRLVLNHRAGRRLQAACMPHQSCSVPCTLGKMLMLTPPTYTIPQAHRADAARSNGDRQWDTAGHNQPPLREYVLSVDFGWVPRTAHLTITHTLTLAPLSHYNYNQSASLSSWCPCSSWSRWAPTEGGPRAT